MTNISKCVLATVVLAALALGTDDDVAHAQGSIGEDPPADSEAVSSVAIDTEPGAGGLRVVERSGDHDAAFALRSIGTGLAVLGVATLAIEGLIIVSCVFEPDCAVGPSDGPVVEAISWAALGAIGGGLVMALVGVLLDVAAPRGPDVTRISARPWLHLDDAGGAAGLSIDL